MIIFFITIEQHGQSHEFTFHSPSLETGLEMVNLIASQGGKLLFVKILDEYCWMPLPVKSFDGQAFLAPIQQLQQQWEQLLGCKGQSGTGGLAGTATG